ncbi:protein DMP6 [Cryptomeria japonica]|uniref:protein DMP6 n=1 Tax=Cryptomeria japonica TaxID=3369 RepID=UPI0027DA530E|nr:protein DMP6 [Cryptomeria japonica]
MAASPKLLVNKKSSTEKVTDKALASAANLVKLLPTTTVLIFQVLSPALTNGGNCFTVNKYLTGFLLGICGLSCFIDSFTDSYQSEDGKIYYGFATKTGLWTFDPSISKTVDLSSYRLKFIDFVHAALSVLVFFTVAMMDTNIVNCYYPKAETNAAIVVKGLPIVVGSFCSLFFMVFPSKRHGIGYPTGT